MYVPASALLFPVPYRLAAMHNISRLIIIDATHRVSDYMAHPLISWNNSSAALGSSAFPMSYLHGQAIQFRLFCNAEGHCMLAIGFVPFGTISYIYHYYFI